MRDQPNSTSGSFELWKLAGGGAGAHPSLVDVLSLLRPAKLARLALTHWQDMPEAVFASLPRFSQLQSHDVVCYVPAVHTSLPPSLAASLARLPQLRSLTCHSFSALPGGLVEAISQHLAQLTHLVLRSDQPLPALQPLTRLTQLHGLTLMDNSVAGVHRLAPAPASFPNLQNFEYGFEALAQCGGACRCLPLPASCHLSILCIGRRSLSLLGRLSAVQDRKSVV